MVFGQVVIGPPGSGKTALAASLALKSGFPFMKLVSPNGLVGQSEAQKAMAIARVFDDAHKSPLSLIVLDELARSIAPLASIISDERAAETAADSGGACAAAAAAAAPVAGGGQSPARRGAASFSASMLRVHSYSSESDYPPHEDLGLLTLAPRSSLAGLMVQART